MNLITTLEQYATVKNPLVRFFVLLLHMPIVAVLMSLHVVETAVRMFHSFVLGLISNISNTLADSHAFMLAGFKTMGGAILKVAKGPAKVVTAAVTKVKAEVSADKQEIDTVIAEAVAKAPLSVAPVAVAPVVEAPPAPQVAPPVPAPVPTAANIEAAALTAPAATDPGLAHLVVATNAPVNAA